MGNKESIKREKIMLPINDNGKPDYFFMEQYIKNIMLKLKTNYLKEKNIYKLNSYNYTKMHKY